MQLADMCYTVTHSDLKTEKDLYTILIPLRIPLEYNVYNIP